MLPAASLRKRTKTLASNAPDLPEAMSVETMSDAPLKTAPGSQLPSPLSSIDENMMAVIGEPPFCEPSSTRHSRRRKPSASTKSVRRGRSVPSLEDNSEATDAQWIDIPLAVALIPPLGSFLTGGDLLRDILLFILLFFYLHQLIKLPWELYLASRPRGRRISNQDTSPDQERLHDLAADELRTAEFCYLTLSVFTPLLGAVLLRFVGTAVTGKDYISWFSTGVFVLVTGVRPWRHLIHRLRSRTEELQDAVYASRTEISAENISNRVASLEEQIKDLKTVMATKREVRALHEEVDESLDVIDAAVGRQERTGELGRRSAEERFAALEKAVGDALREVRGTPGAWTLAPARDLLQWIRPIAAGISRSPVAVSPSRVIRPGYRPRLPPVREEEDGTVSARSRAKSTSKKSRRQSGGHRVLDMVLFPFSAGRTLLWALLDFLQKRLV